MVETVNELMDEFDRVLVGSVVRGDEGSRHCLASLATSWLHFGHFEQLDDIGEDINF